MDRKFYIVDIVDEQIVENLTKAIGTEMRLQIS